MGYQPEQDDPRIAFRKRTLKDIGKDLSEINRYLEGNGDLPEPRPKNGELIVMGKGLFSGFWISKEKRRPIYRDAFFVIILTAIFILFGLTLLGTSRQEAYKEKEIRSIAQEKKIEQIIDLMHRPEYGRANAGRIIEVTE